MSSSPQNDIRWKQRFNNFSAAFVQLENAVKLFNLRTLSQLEKLGLVKAFEFSHELAWNVMKDYLEYQGVGQIIGSRDATREAFSKGLITEGQLWMDMIVSRNLTSHTYNKDLADKIVSDVCLNYVRILSAFKEKMAGLDSGL